MVSTYSIYEDPSYVEGGTVRTNHLGMWDCSSQLFVEGTVRAKHVGVML